MSPSLHGHKWRWEWSFLLAKMQRQTQRGWESALGMILSCPLVGNMASHSPRPPWQRIQHEPFTLTCLAPCFLNFSWSSQLLISWIDFPVMVLLLLWPKTWFCTPSELSLCSLSVKASTACVATGLGCPDLIPILLRGHDFHSQNGALTYWIVKSVFFPSIHITSKGGMTGCIR